MLIAPKKRVCDTVFLPRNTCEMLSLTSLQVVLTGMGRQGFIF